MSGGIEPGWHADPLGRHESRYWDGAQWTEHVADAGVQSTDPLDPPQQTGAVDPTQTIVAAGGAYGAAPGDPSSAPTDALPQYANTGAQKSGGFPVVPVIIGLVVAAAVVAGLVFLIGGGDDGGDDFGSSTATLSADDPVAVYEVSLAAGEGVRFRAVPQSPNLDPVWVVALSEDEADALFSDAVADDLAFDVDQRSDLFPDVADDVLTDHNDDDTGIARGDLAAVDTIDCCGSGEAEADSFVAPRSATYTLVLYDYFEEEGELDVRIEQWEGSVEFESLSDFISEFSDLSSEDSFFSDAEFFSEGNLFSDFSDDFFSDFSDFTDNEFFSDLSDFADPFSDFSDFSDLSDLSDFSDFSDAFTDFLDPFTDFFSDFADEFSDFGS
ncbi:MAG: DUF2510 domain-containing protein [Acidimicrobiia bacterium]|nr:DUF2510 domain-containing protein [Acidimicrobiia bacterium]